MRWKAFGFVVLLLCNISVKKSFGCEAPNSIDKTIYHENCNLKTPAIFHIEKVVSKDENGNLSYPVNVGEKILHFDITGRNEGEEVHNILFDLQLQQYTGNGERNCKWKTLPLSPFLKNINPGIDITVPHGDVALPIKFSLHGLGPIICLLADGGYYALNILIKDGSEKVSTPLGCLRVEFQIRK
ncbi:hypothetical protein T4A_13628 [Trichinella pseudospiralis]|uniref:MD-2-related lipid-recognition domain-containing protein n=1 Tax=Trichinella pseudospiralis TaxID=6337 RepID=A0A0V1E5J9_TRIPS|nr:hypothetical protein T4E_9247 [Trichinella pseudospiralis]KRX87378.1 hypothetical protein T4E_7321 [Trichinella pseudospiralis]KRY69095.1 hypothetical protein T4A_13628 [Trichinella pseudospiralis]KRY89184.1 hypothetical protein T4D_6803 [Trichinella pseudospiralis]